MTPEERMTIQHAAHKLETSSKLERKLRSGEELNPHECELRGGVALDLDEIDLVARVLRRDLYLDVRQQDLDALARREKEAEDQQWKALSQYHAVIDREVDDPGRAERARNARPFFDALFFKRNKTRGVWHLVNYLAESEGATQTGAIKKAALILGAKIGSVKTMYARGKRARVSPRG